MKTARIRAVSAAFVVLFVLVALQIKRNGAGGGLMRFGSGEDAFIVGKLSEAYAVCGTIWTGAEPDETSKKSCFVVQGKTIIDTGSLGACSFLRHPVTRRRVSTLNSSSSSPESIRKTYGDKDTLGPPTSYSAQIPLSARQTGLKIHILPKGAAVTVSFGFQCD
jgi:hypothetical protein